MDVSALGLSAPYASAITVAAIVVPLLWVVARSRSLFMVRHRLWRLLHRSTTGQEAWLDEAVRERFELMRFRALVMWADSLAEARRISTWATGQGIDLGSLGDCGKYFHRHRLDLREKLPPLLRAKAVTDVAILAFAGAIITLASLAGGDAALLRLRHDHTWIVTSPVAARPLTGGTGQDMTLDDCKTHTDAAGFGEANRAIVCRTLADADLKKLVKEGLFAQRMLLLVAILGLLGLIATLQRNLAALRAAHATRAWLQRSGGGEKPGAELPSAAEPSG
jgi:hypothetical protein